MNRCQLRKQIIVKQVLRVVHRSPQRRYITCQCTYDFPSRRFQAHAHSIAITMQRMHVQFDFFRATISRASVWLSLACTCQFLSFPRHVFSDGVRWSYTRLHSSLASSLWTVCSCCSHTPCREQSFLSSISFIFFLSFVRSGVCVCALCTVCLQSA